MHDGSEIVRKGNLVSFENDSCFVCGENNPIGLHLHFYYDRDTRSASSSVTFKPEHVGWDDVVHGGILASVLDDVMAHSLFTLDFLGITTRINVTYREAVRVGELVYLEGTVGRIGSRTGDVSGSIYAVGETGEKIIKCEAEGTYFLDRQNKNQ